MQNFPDSSGSYLEHILQAGTQIGSVRSSDKTNSDGDNNQLSPRNTQGFPLYFLLGELPLEANLHMDVLILFWNVWSNPQTTVFKTTKYILMMTDNTSVSWAAHVRILCQTYHLPNPLALL